MKDYLVPLLLIATIIIICLALVVRRLCDKTTRLSSSGYQTLENNNEGDELPYMNEGRKMA